MSNGKTPVGTIILKVFVRSPGGQGIPDATVTLEDPPGTATTGPDGVARIPVKEKELAGKDSVKVQARKRHHGPIVAPGTDFRNGPDEASAKVSEPQGGFDKSDPKVDSQGRLHLALVDGGTLGRAYYYAQEGGPAILTRRLSQDQVQQELLYRVGHGEVTLAAGQELVINHDPNSGDDDDCTSACTIATPYTQRRHVKPDRFGNVRFFFVTRLYANASRIRVRDLVAGDVRNLNQRLIVGMVRMCKLLHDELAVAACYTQGFLRNAADAHARGRAFDFAGAATAPVTAEKKLIEEDGLNVYRREWDVRDTQDFVIWYHWGMPHLQVRTLATGAASRRHPDDGRNYDPAGASVPERLLYRLEPVPAEDERNNGDARTTQHFQAASWLFRVVYDFCVKEFSNLDTRLGPVSGYGTAEQQDASNADDALFPIDIGSFQGHVIHPDYPEGALRTPHNNHIHLQLGSRTPTQETWE